MCFMQDRAVFTLNGMPVKLVYKFKYYGSNILSAQSNVSIHIGKA